MRPLIADDPLPLELDGSAMLLVGGRMMAAGSTVVISYTGRNSISLESWAEVAEVCMAGLSDAVLRLVMMAASWVERARARASSAASRRLDIHAYGVSEGC